MILTDNQGRQYIIHVTHEALIEHSRHGDRWVRVTAGQPDHVIREQADAPKFSHRTTVWLHIGQCEPDPRECKKLHASGEALCSVSDQFKRQKGIKIALARAIKSAGLDGPGHKEWRKSLWKSYFKRTNFEVPGLTDAA